MTRNSNSLNPGFPVAEWNRKLIHLSSSSLALGYWLLGREISICLFTFFFLGMLIAETLRFKTAWGQRQYRKIFGTMTREVEGSRITGATWVFAGALVSAAAFDKHIAIAAMLFMSIGDSVAALVGLRWGRHRLGTKSLEGSLACFVACLIIGLLLPLPVKIAIVGAMVATLTELFPPPLINDNVSVPFLAGTAMAIMTGGWT